MKQILDIVAKAMVALALVFGVSGPALADECISKIEAQRMTDSGEAWQLSDAMARAGETRKPISTMAQLCRDDNGLWVWKLRVSDGYEADEVILPAQ